MGQGAGKAEGPERWTQPHEEEEEEEDRQYKVPEETVCTAADSGRIQGNQRVRQGKLKPGCTEVF